jgi:uncharacterized protein (TIGR04141 family)
MDTQRTREATLYRLAPRVGATHDSMFDAYNEYMPDEKLTELGADPEFIEVAGAPAIWIGLQGSTDPADWCADAAVTTGLPMPFTACRSGGVLLIGIDDTAYAMSYGSGYLYIPDKLKDKRFGLSFLIRRLNSNQVCDLVRRRPDARGRTDSTVIHAGAPAWTLGIAENAEIIRRIGGRAKDLKTTFGAKGAKDDRPVNVEGGVGLRTRYAITQPGLVADIREVARVCREEEPDPDLDFIQNIQPVTDTAILAQLEEDLEVMLSWGTDEAADSLVPVIPDSVLDSYREARSFTLKIGSIRIVRPTLELGDILQRTQRQRDGQRVGALRHGTISLNADEAGRVELAHADADKWIEASVSVGPHRYFVMDGDWYEIGADYVHRARAAIAKLFLAKPSVVLPAWPLSDRPTEREYNEYVADGSCGDYLCLDRSQKVRNPHGPRDPIEPCDLLGPHNELIHVKQAEGSAPLSHLFAQGHNSAELLHRGPAIIREQFARAVNAFPHGRVIDDEWRPETVVYAIRMKNGKQLTPDTLFPFSQVTLAHAAKSLGTYGIKVEVIGIPTA